MPAHANPADREPAGFVVVDYRENPAGATVLGPTSLARCTAYVRRAAYGVRVERAYLAAEA